jgi:hypothetical protein
MATKKYRCYRECFTYNKRFKKGEYFPVLWIEHGYAPNEEYFVPEEDYEDFIRAKARELKTVYSAADDPRSSEALVADLKKYMEVPKDWTRKRVWLALKQREMAEAKTEPTPRRPGRPALNKD